MSTQTLEERVKVLEEDRMDLFPMVQSVVAGQTVIGNALNFIRGMTEENSEEDRVLGMCVASLRCLALENAKTVLRLYKRYWDHADAEQRAEVEAALSEVKAGVLGLTAEEDPEVLKQREELLAMLGEMK